MLWPTAQEKSKRPEVRDALAAASFTRNGDRITISGTVPAEPRENLSKCIIAVRSGRLTPLMRIEAADVSRGVA